MGSDVTGTNLITLFGKNGSGKTRLLMTMEQSVLSGQVMRIGAETLIDDLVSGIRSQISTEVIFKPYRDIDTLLIDNLWVLVSLPHVSKTIRELVETRIANEQLTVLASDLTFDQWSARQPEMAGFLAGGRMAQLS
jgi:chromosomal replication initiation ATPase DnaA